jgi:hypothetical protein
MLSQLPRTDTISRLQRTAERESLRPLSRGPLGDEAPTPAKGAHAVADTIASGTWVTDALGRASETLDPLPAGSYEATARRVDAALAEARAPGSESVTKDIPQARRVFLVREAGHELAQLAAAPGRERLARLAEVSGGASLVISEGEALPRALPLQTPDDPEAMQHVEHRRELPLWDSWPALLLVLCGFAGEWILRRRNGLP